MRTRAGRLLCCVVVVLVSLAGRVSLGADRPNVLLIAVDDLNDWIGPLGGHPQAKTPNLDRLAARGMVFTNAHCQAPLCNPSRVSLLTGRRPSTTGVYALDPWFRAIDALKALVTLPQHFQANGYATMSTGKIFHDGMPAKSERKDGVEFMKWGHAGSHGPYPKEKLVGTESKSPLLDWGVFPERDEQLQDYKVATWAVEQLAEAPKDKPFFLCVGFRRPHVPCLAPRKWVGLYPDDDSLFMPPMRRDDRADVPASAALLHWKIPEPRLAWLEEQGQWRNLVRSYLACISFMDAQVGRVLDALDASGAAGNTVVVLWSDHGWHLGEKGMTGKLSLWERSTRVPLIFAGPGVSTGRCDQPAELLDVYPTLAELCGLPPGRGVEGRSLIPQFNDPPAAREAPAITTLGPKNHAVRTGRWRYIRYFDGAEELYDHHSDPHEWTNLAGDPQHAQTKAKLAKWLPAVNAPAVEGSVTRHFEIRGGRRYWEGKPVEGPGDFDADAARTPPSRETTP